MLEFLQILNGYTKPAGIMILVEAVHEHRLCFLGHATSIGGKADTSIRSHKWMTRIYFGGVRSIWITFMNNYGQVVTYEGTFEAEDRESTSVEDNATMEWP